MPTIIEVIIVCMMMIILIDSGWLININLIDNIILVAINIIISAGSLFKILILEIREEYFFLLKF